MTYANVYQALPNPGKPRFLLIKTRFLRQKPRFIWRTAITKTIFPRGENEVYPLESSLQNEVYPGGFRLMIKPS
jgi:hypothetical protein